MTFYDQSGSPVVYSHDDTHLYLFSGDPVGYLRRDSVYGFNGRHFGWFLNGWIYDHGGSPLFFSEKCKGGPLKPLKQVTPLKSVRKLRPLKSLRQLPPLKPLRTLAWSGITVEVFLTFRGARGTVPWRTEKGSFDPPYLLSPACNDSTLRSL